MFNLTSMARKLIVAVIIIFFAITAGAAVFYFGNIEGFLRFALGLFLGSSCAIVRIISMDITVRKTVENGSGGVFAFLIRYFLTVVILGVAAFFEIFNLWAAIAGVFSLPVAAYIVPIITKED